MPHLYTDASNVLKLSQQNKSSLKSLVFNSSSSQSLKKSKALFALVCETLKYRKVIDELTKRTKLSAELKAFHKNEWLLRVCVFEHMFGKGLRGKYKTLLEKYQVRLQSELARYKVQHKISDNSQLVAEENKKSQTIPRYVRINTLKANIGDVIAKLSAEYSYIKTSQCSFSEFITAVKALGKKQFMRDIHMSELLVFAAGSDLHTHELYKNGSIILQDKASCFPGYVLSSLDIDQQSHVIDSCAAPGNKTSHAAAVLNNKGKIYAFDKDARRIETMKKLLDKAGATCVQVENEDFLKVNISDERYRNVTHVIVDPSCTGSGIVSRLNHLTDNKNISGIEERVEKLSVFQEKILTHAMSFPAVRYVVYSTCSIHEGENEQVVKRTLETYNDTYELHNILPHYPNRGLECFGNIGQCCIRLDPENDRTNGFFVACLKKKYQGDNCNSYSKTGEIHTGSMCVEKGSVKFITKNQIKLKVKKFETNEKTVDQENVVQIQECKVSQKRRLESADHQVNTAVNKKISKDRKKSKNVCSNEKSVLYCDGTSDKCKQIIETKSIVSTKENHLEKHNAANTKVQNNIAISSDVKNVKLTLPKSAPVLISLKKQKRNKKRNNKPVTAR